MKLSAQAFRIIVITFLLQLNKIAMVVFVVILFNCNAWAEGLIGPSSFDEQSRHNCQISCLRQATGESKPEVGFNEELIKLLIKDKSTKGFLWHGSLSGPRLVKERNDGVLVPQQSLFNALRSGDLTDRFVFCLLTHGYRWESSEKDGIAEITELAEKGNAMAQSTLGLMYYYGHGVKVNNTVAVEWMRKAAEQGYANAQYNLGVAYGKGDGVATDEAEAIKWIQKAADQGHTQAKNSIIQIKKEQTLTTAKLDDPEVEMIRKAADQGDVEAQWDLATRYEDGNGVKRDMQMAISWYKKAAEQKLAKAQTYLGVIYDKGRGVTQDDDEAIKWYIKAAESGDPQGQFNLGIFYLTGRGTKKDEDAGWTWVRKAAKGGSPNARALLRSSGK